MGSSPGVVGPQDRVGWLRRQIQVGEELLPRGRICLNLHEGEGEGGL